RARKVEHEVVRGGLRRQNEVGLSFLLAEDVHAHAGEAHVGLEGRLALEADVELLGRRPDQAEVEVPRALEVEVVLLAQPPPDGADPRLAIAVYPAVHGGADAQRGRDLEAGAEREDVEAALGVDEELQVAAVDRAVEAERDRALEAHLDGARAAPEAEGIGER